MNAISFLLCVIRYPNQFSLLMKISCKDLVVIRQKRTDIRARKFVLEATSHRWRQVPCHPGLPCADFLSRSTPQDIENLGHLTS